MKIVPYNYIAIEGCIGAGKTSLTEMFAADFVVDLILEQFTDNNFLPKFYKDPEHYAFPVELTFLTDRYHQLKTLFAQRKQPENMIFADYFIDKCNIFAKNNLQADEYHLFFNVYEIIANLLPKPDLIIYLYNDADRLLKNIAKRGRDYEQNISADYLNDIQEGYLDHLKSTDISTILIKSHKFDFVKNARDYIEIKELLYQKHAKGFTVIE